MSMTIRISHLPRKVMSRIAGQCRQVLLFAALLCLLPLAVHATENVSVKSPVAKDDIQLALERQLTAFKDRNSALAYDGLSAASKEKYKSPLRFATIMRLNFWTLYNHHSYRFLARTGDSKTEIQKVEVKADDKVPHVFLFRMVKADNGVWLIDDVFMLADDGQQI